jgi:hypothetical protein
VLQICCQAPHFLSLFPGGHDRWHDAAATQTSPVVCVQRLCFYRYSVLCGDSVCVASAAIGDDGVRLRLSAGGRDPLPAGPGRPVS